MPMKRSGTWLSFWPRKRAKSGRKWQRRRRQGRSFSVNQRRSLRVFKGSGSLGSQVQNIGKYLNQTAPEIKYSDVSLSQTDIGDPGSVLHISNIAQGDTLGTRTGNSISVKSITVKGRFNTPVAVTPTGNSYYRLALVIDRQQVADTAPAFTDIFDNSDPTFVFPNENSLGRFTYMWMSRIFDPRRLGFSTALTTTTIPTQSPFWEFTWTGNLVIRYNGTASTDIQKNGIYFVVMTTDLNDALDITGVGRIGFTDD